MWICYFSFCMKFLIFQNWKLFIVIVYESYKVTNDEDNGIKLHLLNFQCNVNILKAVPSSVRKQISESIRLIAEKDYPHKWPTLLPELTNLLSKSCQSNDISIIKEGLSTINEIFKTKKNGEFQIVLKPGIYTFFILKDDKVYLNHFDGLGNYSYVEVKDNIEKIIIRDYQNAYF